MMPAGRNRCDNGVSTEAAAGGTWLRIRNRRASQLVAPALTDSAEAAKSTTPRPASSPAARASEPGPGGSATTTIRARS